MKYPSGSYQSYQQILERRQCIRLPYQTPVRIYAEPSSPTDLFFELDSSDVSPMGLFIRSGLLFPVGEWMDLELTVPGHDIPLRRLGRVVRVSASEFPPGPGMGIELSPPV